MCRECRVRFPPSSQVGDPDMHQGTCMTHVPWSMPGSLTSGFLWSRWLGKRSRHSRHMRNPHFYVSGKRPMVEAAHGRSRFTWTTSSTINTHSPVCKLALFATRWWQATSVYTHASPPPDQNVYHARTHAREKRCDFPKVGTKSRNRGNFSGINRRNFEKG